MQYESDIITVAAANFKVEAGQKENNLSRILDFSKSAAKRGADLIVFPEMCVSGYDFYTDESTSQKEKEEMAEIVNGPVCDRLSLAAGENNIYIVAGMAEKDGVSGGLYNSAFAFGPEGFIGVYRKIHPFYKENTWCRKGSEPFMFGTKWGPVSVGICYDTYNFPELIRYYASKGSRLYLNLTALAEKIELPDSRREFLEYYGTMLEYGVRCNTIFIASANLTGKDKQSYFGGGSCVIGPKITPVTEAERVHYYAGGKDDVQAGLVMATIDLSLARRILFTENKYTGEPDYRPEIYKNWE